MLAVIRNVIFFMQKLYIWKSEPYKTFPKRLHLLRGVYLEIHKKRRYSFGPLQNTRPPLNREEDSEGAIPMSDKEPCEMEYKRYLLLNT